jgi:serine/threonine-protein kinase OSR1/STK39
MFTVFKEGLPPLTQRQERRATRHLTHVSTVDSWDFALSSHSPTSTIPHRRPIPEDTLSPTPEYQEKFDFGDDDEAPPKHATGPISATISFTEGGMLANHVDRNPPAPPTDSPFLTYSTPKLSEKAVLSPHYEESSKRSFWSRINPKLRRSSSLRGINSFVLNTDDDQEKSSSSSSISQSRVVVKSSGKHTDVSVRPATSDGSTRMTRRSSPKKGRKLGGLIGEAKSMFSRL